MPYSGAKSTPLGPQRMLKRNYGGMTTHDIRYNSAKNTFGATGLAEIDIERLTREAKKHKSSTHVKKVVKDQSRFR